MFSLSIEDNLLSSVVVLIVGAADRCHKQNRHYLGDDFYPAIIDQETFDKAESIRLERAGKLGRLNLLKSSKPIEVPTHFRFAEADEEYEDPRLQAEYLYSLIESEAI